MPTTIPTRKVGTGLNPWLSAGGVKPFIPYFPKAYGLAKVKRRIDPISHKFIQKLSPLLTNSFYSFLSEVSSIICHNNSFYFYLNQYDGIFDNRKKTM